MVAPYRRLACAQRRIQKQRQQIDLRPLYRRLIETRRLSEALKRGSYHPVAAKGDMLIYVRVFHTDRILIMRPGPLLRGCRPRMHLKVSYLYPHPEKHEGDFVDQNAQLDANEGLVIKLAPDVDISLIELSYQNANAVAHHCR